MTTTAPPTLAEADASMRAAVAAGDLDEAMRLAELADTLADATPAPLPSLHSAALWYAEVCGLRVFPLTPGAKIPLPRSHGCKDATTDVPTINRWWTSVPDANIGIATGHLVDVVDIDGHVGQKSRAEHWEAPGPFGQIDSDSIAKVLTPRLGGMHIYVPATGDGNSAGLVPGVDYRGVGGYVVAPPSHTDVGSYRFLGVPALSEIAAVAA